jgi:hypothetical protein
VGQSKLRLLSSVGGGHILPRMATMAATMWTSPMAATELTGQTGLVPLVKVVWLVAQTRMCMPLSAVLLSVLASGHISLVLAGTAELALQEPVSLEWCATVMVGLLAC